AKMVMRNCPQSCLSTRGFTNEKQRGLVCGEGGLGIWKKKCFDLCRLRWHLPRGFVKEVRTLGPLQPGVMVVRHSKQTNPPPSHHLVSKPRLSRLPTLLERIPPMVVALSDSFFFPQHNTHVSTEY